MGNRRAFLKQTAALGVASWPENHPADSQDNLQPLTGEGRAPNIKQDDIALENAEMRLVISPAGFAQSLIHKATGQECLATGTSAPMFMVTQYRPYDNELQLSYPAKVTSFAAQKVRQEGDRLLVSFPLVGYEAAIRVKITSAYIGFQIEGLTYKGFTELRPKNPTPIDETIFVQLPIRDRKNFGDWLNVTWDDAVAVNLLATDPYAKIDAEPRQGHHLFRAGTVDEIKQEGVGAALIVTRPPHLLDRISRLEEDFDLPRGAQSRRCQEYRYSYYEVLKCAPAEIDQHIQYARAAGFRLVDLYYQAFAKTTGHFPWRPEYPGEMADLQGVVKKIRDAGMTPGIHIHYNKAHKEDAYVTPIPDRRLNLAERFTLAEEIDAVATIITIDQNPRVCTMDDKRRIIKVQNELISYERYTTQPSYRFEGCQRGALGTQAAAHKLGCQVGLLDVDTWPAFVRFTQDTNIQEEVADRLGKIYSEAGFEFVYFDGAEDVPPPYWYTVSRAQWVVHRGLKPQPLFCEGACKSHFSWHMLTRGNAFDVAKPEVMKAAVRAYPAAEITRVEKDFTKINFGWIGYWAPSRETIGTQPDMLEYATSRAAAWDCPISLDASLSEFGAHPRTPDNLEVIRRWEDVRARGWLTARQKTILRDLQQEHLLLVNERGEFELAPYQQIEKAAGADRPARAFVFERQGSVWVVYWHTSGEGILEIPVGASHVKLMRGLGKPVAAKGDATTTQLPIGERRFLQCAGLTRQQAIAAFQKGKLL
jgi:hypothetical protein